MPVVAGLRDYRPPLTGFESHVSGLDHCRNKLFSKEKERLEKRLKNMKPMIDNTPPRTCHMRHLKVNRKKKENDFQRFSQIERENFRLLDSMSKIMVRGAADSVFGVHSNINCPALSTAKGREIQARRVVQENQVLVKRILETKAYYKKQDFDRHQQSTLSAMANMCKYPNQVFPGPHAHTSIRPHSSAHCSLSSSSLSSGGGPRARVSASANTATSWNAVSSSASSVRASKHRAGAVSAPPPEELEEEQRGHKLQRQDQDLNLVLDDLPPVAPSPDVGAGAGSARAANGEVEVYVNDFEEEDAEAEVEEDVGVGSRGDAAL